MRVREGGMIMGTKSERRCYTAGFDIGEMGQELRNAGSLRKLE